MNIKTVCCLLAVSFLCCDGLGNSVRILETDCEQSLEFYDENKGAVVFQTQGLYYGFATCLYKANRYQEAEALLVQGLELAGNPAESYWLLARMNSEKGQFKKSISLYTKALETQKNSRIYANRGLSYQRIGELDLALIDLSVAIELEEANPYAYNNRGLVYVQLGQFEKAKTDFDESERLDATNPYVYKNRGLLALAVTDTLAACLQFNKANSIGFEIFRDPAAELEVNELIKEHCQ